MERMCRRWCRGTQQHRADASWLKTATCLFHRIYFVFKVQAVTRDSERLTLAELQVHYMYACMYVCGRMRPLSRDIEVERWVHGYFWLYGQFRKICKVLLMPVREIVLFADAISGNGSRK